MATRVAEDYEVVAYFLGFSIPLMTMKSFAAPAVALLSEVLLARGGFYYPCTIAPTPKPATAPTPLL